MFRFFAILVCASACVPEGERQQRAGAGPADPGAEPTVTTWTTTGGTTADQVQCDLLPDLPARFTEYNLQTEEDFAFDGEGRLLFQDGSAIVGGGPGGGTELVAVGAPDDPSGLAMISPSELAIAVPDHGAVELLDLDTGSITTLAAGLEQPNGLAAGWDGLLYVTERVAGRVLWLDPTSGDVGVVVSGLERPNGLALAHDGNRLYVATEDGITAVDRGAADWSQTMVRRVYAFPEAQFVGTVAVDLCGFVYSIGYFDGQVLRIDTQTGDAELIVDLDAGASFGFGTLRFGTGGAWPRNVLYTSNRRVVTGIEVGIPGVQSPAVDFGR